MIFIDGKPMPVNGKSMLNSAIFIAQNLRPDSEITWFDFEGGEAPTYEGLKAYAEYVLGPFVDKVEKVTRAPSHPEIRLAVAKVCGLGNTIAS